MAARSDREREFAEFVALRYADLVRTAVLLTGDRGHAEDLVQRALLAVFRSWDRLDRVANAEAYTRTTMVRLASRWWRRRWRAEVPTQWLPDRPIGDHAPDVDTAEVVRQALASLPWAQRAVLVMRYFEERSEAEIAEVLGCSPGTVKSRASRGLAALRAVVHIEGVSGRERG
ncbi:RNA polymerase sigma24 factor [Asanoa ishikariensis]|uniref:RNA polymerase sigma-70 factor, sigma-E family n=1 Tax=Asanoa ishikariensis TaxID=137265 RepID=A0A1H3UGW9_9ACTN|nr:SigE family RNA polymerase sigma factor [Asanoa ishikariensis]GIF63569.1 RNA polymerase sigma24 factor [Asanoa ishikariensis]SDZ61546.1 RNA polymerase sigma-70 factor, sigma-E family [Asanoa ishikariensis]